MIPVFSGLHPAVRAQYAVFIKEVDLPSFRKPAGHLLAGRCFEIVLFPADCLPAGHHFSVCIKIPVSIPCRALNASDISSVCSDLLSVDRRAYSHCAVFQEIIRIVQPFILGKYPGSSFRIIFFPVQGDPPILQFSAGGKIISSLADGRHARHHPAVFLFKIITVRFAVFCDLLPAGVRIPLGTEIIIILPDLRKPRTQLTVFRKVVGLPVQLDRSGNHDSFRSKIIFAPAYHLPAGQISRRTAGCIHLALCCRYPVRLGRHAKQNDQQERYYSC